MVRFAAGSKAGVVRIEGLADGIWSAEMVRADGSRVAIGRAMASEGGLELTLPAGAATGFLVLNGPGSRREVHPVAPFAMSATSGK